MWQGGELKGRIQDAKRTLAQSIPIVIEKPNNLQESLVFLFMSEFQRKMSRSAENSDSESTWKPWLKWNSYTTAAAATSTLLVGTISVITVQILQCDPLSCGSTQTFVTFLITGPLPSTTKQKSVLFNFGAQVRVRRHSNSYHISSSWILRLLWLYKAICLLWFPQGGVRHAAHVL